MQPFLISKAEQKKFADLKTYAEAHPFSVDDLLDIYNKKAPPPGENPNLVILIPVGYRIVFAIMHQMKGLARHLSISVHPIKVNKLPAPAICQEVMKYLGFKKTIGTPGLHCHFENDNTAINIIEYI